MTYQRWKFEMKPLMEQIRSGRAMDQTAVQASVAHWYREGLSDGDERTTEVSYEHEGFPAKITGGWTVRGGVQVRPQ